MVADFYSTLGFEPIASEGLELPDGATVWNLDAAQYRPRNQHIRVTERANG